MCGLRVFQLDSEDMLCAAALGLDIHTRPSSSYKPCQWRQLNSLPHHPHPISTSPEEPKYPTSQKPTLDALNHQRPPTHPSTHSRQRNATTSPLSMMQPSLETAEDEEKLQTHASDQQGLMWGCWAGETYTIHPSSSEGRPRNGRAVLRIVGRVHHAVVIGAEEAAEDGEDDHGEDGDDDAVGVSFGEEGGMGGWEGEYHDQALPTLTMGFMVMVELGTVVLKGWDGMAAEE